MLHNAHRLRADFAQASDGGHNVICMRCESGIGNRYYKQWPPRIYGGSSGLEFRR